MGKLNTLLVVGNGFDRAHDMKTSYKDIIYAIMAQLASWNQDVVFSAEQKDACDKHAFNEEMLRMVIDAYKKTWEDNNSKKIDEFKSEKMSGSLSENYQYARDYIVLYGNWWVNHFTYVLSDRNRRIGEGWVDFESEIHRVVSDIEKVLLHEECEDDIDFLFGGYARDLVALRERFIPELKNDLSILDAIIEYYLSREEEQCEKGQLSIISSLKNVKAVISYNYTHTYQKIYDKALENVCYLHGEIGKNNLVMGTNETLPDKLKNKLVDCASFKKLYQLIYYRLGSCYKNVFSKDANSDDEWEAVIFGHSLTPADEYSLKWLFDKKDNYFADRIKCIKIYYDKEKSYNEQLTNLFQIIGQEKVLEYITNENIEFVKIPMESDGQNK